MIHDFFHSWFSVCILKWECVPIACLFESYLVWACERVGDFVIHKWSFWVLESHDQFIQIYFAFPLWDFTDYKCHLSCKKKNAKLTARAWPPRAWPIKSGWNISLVRSKAVAIASCVSVLNLGIKCTCRDDSKKIFIVFLVSLSFCVAECLIYKEVKLLNFFFLQRIIIVGLKFTYKINSPRFVGVY